MIGGEENLVGVKEPPLYHLARSIIEDLDLSLSNEEIVNRCNLTSTSPHGWQAIVRPGWFECFAAILRECLSPEKEPREELKEQQQRCTLFANQLLYAGKPENAMEPVETEFKDSGNSTTSIVIGLLTRIYFHQTASLVGIEILPEEQSESSDGSDHDDSADVKINQRPNLSLVE